MKAFRPCVALTILVLCVPAGAFACLWDYDTLRQERARFPNALELITGKFLRHSEEFYEWRIQDRLRKMESRSDELSFYDDLAVAYEKTGQRDKAIETMLAKEKISPGHYETYANLGTFYVLGGEFEQGLVYIDKALAINPDAHFGRERIQKWLVEYVLSRRRDDQLALPLSRKAGDVAISSDGFRGFLKSRIGGTQLSDKDLQDAITGILGMMRFANHDNPILLEALGDLLTSGWTVDRTQDAKRLAARAYLKASYEVEDSDAKQGYRDLAQSALAMQTKRPNTTDQLELTDLEAEFKMQLADAEHWYEALKNRELGWIRDGKNPEPEFDHLYIEEPIALGDAADKTVTVVPFRKEGLLFLVALSTLVCALFAIVYLNRRRMRQSDSNKASLAGNQLDQGSSERDPRV